MPRSGVARSGSLANPSRAPCGRSPMAVACLQARSSRNPLRRPATRRTAFASTTDVGSLRADGAVELTEAGGARDELDIAELGVLQQRTHLLGLVQREPVLRIRELSR